jgi:hypothetical protein
MKEAARLPSLLFALKNKCNEKNNTADTPHACIGIMRQAEQGVYTHRNSPCPEICKRATQ